MMRKFSLLRVFIFALFYISCNSIGSRKLFQTCTPSGTIQGTDPPLGECNKGDYSTCCKEGQTYTTYQCSPLVTVPNAASLTLNGFQHGQDGGGRAECDNQYHSDDEMIIALSTGWYNGGTRCLKNVIISANGISVTAMVVDECDSTMGCDEEHDYQPPCGDNVVDASRAVWEGLGISKERWGDSLDVTWSDV